LKVGPENLKNRTMKAILIKKIFSGDEYQYTLYLDGEVGIYAKSGIGHGWFKLSKQNCDEIFGVVDVEKLAYEHRRIYQDSFEGMNECIMKDAMHQQVGFKAGFNKAMELNKDKQFTLEDVLNAYMEGTNDGTQFESLMDYDSEDFDEAHEFAKEAEKEFRESLQQPIEIEVEIEMETCSMNPLDLNCDEIIERPKLDSEGCLILKKIEQ
jgi:hypothetical protein